MIGTKSLCFPSPLFARFQSCNWSVWFAIVLAANAALAQPTFSVPQRDLPTPLVMVAYGDMRFTTASETDASSPPARRALIAKVAAERPAAIFLNGDIPWHGIPQDYAVYRDETYSWRQAQLRVYAALGELNLAAQLVGQQLPSLPVVFGAAILDADDGIFARQFRVEIDQ